MAQEYSRVEKSGLQMFERFEYTKSLPEQEKIEIIREAVRFGEKRADELKAEFRSAVPSQILNMQGILILEENDKDNTRPNFVKFAEFHVKQKKVLLNSQVLRIISRQMERDLVKEIILCHEMYHYFEMFRWGRTGDSFKRKVKLFQMIPVTRRILPAEEIAANAFTKAYLKLEFEPQELEQIYFNRIK
ncbi:hypothetical protein [Lacrimispora indolis]|uniref:hypothetical protein n=1 Tax=Lacrimispora indolis TaxID=69825 RepID=UPI00045E5F3C|nr:hypothetical protein [Lacrimispora indolis]